MPPDGRCYPTDPLDFRGSLAGTWEQSIAKNIQLFGQLEASGIPLPVGLFVGGSQWAVREPEKRQRLWLVETFVQEAYRTGEGPFSPLERSAIISGTGATTRSQRGVVQLQINLQNYAGGGALRMDGGQSIELWAVGLSAQLLTTGNTVEVVPNEVSTATGSFTVFDSLFSVAMTPLAYTRGKSRCSFTEWVHVAADTRALIEIPAYARKVQIRQTSPGAASAAWTAELTGTLTTSPGFNIPFTGRQTDIVGIGYATHLRSDLDAAVARNFEVVYFMEP